MAETNDWSAEQTFEKAKEIGFDWSGSTVTGFFEDYMKRREEGRS